VAALILALAAAASARAAPPGGRDPIDRWSAYIREAAVRASLPELWIRRVMRAESGGQTMVGGRPIKSAAGAMGLMQLMPATWSEMRVRLSLGSDPFDPHDNILAGAAFLRMMYDRFGYPGLFGAYNAGPRRYAAHLAGVALPAETVGYLAKVAGDAPVRMAALPPAMPSLFVTAHPSENALGNKGGSTGLFAIRHDVPAEDAEQPTLAGGE